MSETITAQKLTYYSLPWTEFIRDPENLRQDLDAHIEAEGLKELIKADGGVRNPVFVTTKKHSIDGKRVILDGSSRHRCLELLSEDPEYLEAVERDQASLDLPFFVVPDDILNDPIALTKFKLSTNWVNPQTKSVEQWDGIKKILDHYRQEFLETNLDSFGITDISEADPDLLEKIKTKQNGYAIPKTAKTLGKSTPAIHRYTSVFEDGHPRVLELIDQGVLVSVKTAADVARFHKKLTESGSNITVDEFVNLCLENSIKNNRPTLGDVTVERTYKELLLPKPELNNPTDNLPDATAINGIDSQAEVALQKLKTEVDGLDKSENVDNNQTVNNGSNSSDFKVNNESSGEYKTERKQAENSNESEEIYDRLTAIGDINDLIAIAEKIDDDQLWKLPEKNILRIGKTCKMLIKEFETLQDILGKQRQQEFQDEEKAIANSELNLNSNVQNVETDQEEWEDQDSEDDSEDDVEFEDVA